MYSEVGGYSCFSVFFFFFFSKYVRIYVVDICKTHLHEAILTSIFKICQYRLKKICTSFGFIIFSYEDVYQRYMF